MTSRNRGHASFYFWTLETVTVSPHSSVTRNKTQITPATLRNPSPRPHSILASAIKIPGVTHLRGKGEARLTAPISRCVLVLLTNRLSLCMSVAFPARIQSRMVVKKKKGRMVPEKFGHPPLAAHALAHHAITGVSKLKSSRLTVMWHQPAASAHPSIYSSTGSNKSIGRIRTRALALWWGQNSYPGPAPSPHMS